MEKALIVGASDSLQRANCIESILKEQWIEQIDWMEEVDSTNDFLKRHAAVGDHPSTPWLIVADQQTGGRGRGDRKWWSPEGCLMFSLGWCPEKDLTGAGPAWSQLSLVVGLAVAKAIEPYLVSPLQAKVKWPNDVYVNGKKVAGILIEQIIGPGQPIWIIGVGINVSVPFETAPAEIQGSAESLHRVVSSVHREKLNREFILKEVVDSLQITLGEWNSQPSYLEQHWPRHCWLTGKWIEVQIGAVDDRRLSGVCEGVDKDGALLVKDDSGITHSLRSGSITIRA